MDIAALSDSSVERRLVSLGFYDGTTKGFMMLGTDRAFRYDLVSWDAYQNKRVYCLVPIPQHEFERVVNVLQVLGSPKWPVWNPLWVFGTEEARLSAERTLDEISNCGEYHLGVLTEDLSHSGGSAFPLVGAPFDQAMKFKIDQELQSFEIWSSLV
jgi:hypothetical protein